MLNLLGIRLHPAIGFVVGPALIAVGISLATPMLCVVGTVMLLAAAWRSFGTRGR